MYLKKTGVNKNNLNLAHGVAVSHIWHKYSLDALTTCSSNKFVGYLNI